MPASFPLLPGATIGIVGGGQLGRMTAVEARRMGYRTIVIDPMDDSPGAQVADRRVAAPLDDMDAIRDLARHADVVTLEWENADVQALRQLEGVVPLFPGTHVLEVAQHRLREKETARRLGVPTAEFRAVTTLAELETAVAELGVPAVLKTVRGGYDGKGQAVIRSAAECGEAFEAVGGGAGTELILEAWVDFELEASVICARSTTGEIASFPAGENVHRNGILDTTLAPARIPEGIAREAAQIAECMAEGLDVVGLLAIELFLGRDGTLRLNEIAPRPHNSGHHTLEACVVSQFEQHVRAVCGLPLGSPALLRPAVMINLLGEHLPPQGAAGNWLAAFDEPDVHLHLYGKHEAHPGRKMGHLTVLADTQEEALARAHHVRSRLASPR
jgi:5-(carboxyamino)imidazole ribonucleotide synthase